MKFLNAHQQGGQVIIYGKQTNARINYTANIHVFDNKYEDLLKFKLLFTLQK